MTPSDFKVGERFYFEAIPARLWQVTDLGSRVIVAIPVRDGWMDGPPFAQQETAMDETDQETMVKVDA